jgi:membrane associated rhomboid family serine protease
MGERVSREIRFHVLVFLAMGLAMVLGAATQFYTVAAFVGVISGVFLGRKMWPDLPAPPSQDEG